MFIQYLTKKKFSTTDFNIDKKYFPFFKCIFFSNDALISKYIIYVSFKKIYFKEEFSIYFEMY